MERYNYGAFAKVLSQALFPETGDPCFWNCSYLDWKQLRRCLWNSALWYPILNIIDSGREKKCHRNASAAPTVVHTLILAEVISKIMEVQSFRSNLVHQIFSYEIFWGRQGYHGSAIVCLTKLVWSLYRQGSRSKAQRCESFQISRVGNYE